MAGAVVPLITAIAPSIINLIAGLVHQSAPAAEQQYGSGTGAVKFAQVFSDVMAALQKAAAAGQIDKALPSDQTVQMIIQAVVTSMQLSGALPSTAAAPAASLSTVVLKAGQSITIQGQ